MGCRINWCAPYSKLRVPIFTAVASLERAELALEQPEEGASIASQRCHDVARLSYASQTFGNPHHRVRVQMGRCHGAYLPDTVEPVVSGLLYQDRTSQSS